MDFEHMPKVAFLGAIGRGVGNFFRHGAGRYFAGNVTGTKPFQMMAPYGRRAEQWVGNAVGRVAPQHQALAQKMVKGISRPAIREGIQGGVIGGTFGGIQGALSAPEGERMKGFLGGAAQGAALGGGVGILQGTNMGLAKNIRAKALTDLASREGVSAGQLGKRMSDMGFRSTISNAFGRQNTLDRRLARQKLIGGTGAAAAAYVVPNIIENKLTPSPPPPAPKQPPMLVNAPANYYQQQGFQARTASWDPVPPYRPLDFSKMF